MLCSLNNVETHRRVRQSKVKDIVMMEWCKSVVCRGVGKYLHTPLLSARRRVASGVASSTKSPLGDSRPSRSLCRPSLPPPATPPSLRKTQACIQ